MTKIYVLIKVSQTKQINVHITIREVLINIISDVIFDQLQYKAVKYGPFWRKERYFILEQKKQYYAGVIGVWLLVYSCCKKDAKVIQTINLTDYKAEMIEQKKDPTFRIEATNKKTYDVSIICIRVGVSTFGVN